MDTAITSTMCIMPFHCSDHYWLFHIRTTGEYPCLIFQRINKIVTTAIDIRLFPFYIGYDRCYQFLFFSPNVFSTQPVQNKTKTLSLLFLWSTKELANHSLVYPKPFIVPETSSVNIPTATYCTDYTPIRFLNAIKCRTLALLHHFATWKWLLLPQRLWCPTHYVQFVYDKGSSGNDSYLVNSYVLVCRSSPEL